jgi:hypothetical protein
MGRGTVRIVIESVRQKQKTQFSKKDSFGGHSNYFQKKPFPATLKNLVLKKKSFLFLTKKQVLKINMRVFFCFWGEKSVR